MTDSPVGYALEGTVARVRLDDGKVNALSPAAVRALDEAVTRAEAEARALLLEGRPGRFCAGFDLGTMRQGGEAMRGLVAAGGALALRLRESPLPVVIACTGHALAMGAVLLLAADRRLGAAGAFKIGLNEVAIGLTLPRFAIELARARLAPPHLVPAVLNARIHDPEAAVEAGFLDRVVDAQALPKQALEEAQALAELPRRAYVATQRKLLGDALAGLRAGLEADLREMGAPRV